MKNLFKKLAYDTGLLGSVHKYQNQNNLTVVLFHRVLDDKDPRWEYADKAWSVSSSFFRQCVQFFKNHYNIVTLDMIDRHVRKGEKLPMTPLLITFDDGWADNLEYAQPILEQEQLSGSLLFVTVNAIGKQMLSWQEMLYSRWLQDGLKDEDLSNLFQFANSESFELTDESDIRKIIAFIQEQPLVIQNKVLATCQIMAKKLPEKPLMLSREELQELFKRGFEVGTHGLNHEAMTQIDQLDQELIVAKSQLIKLIPDCDVTSMSYPLGRTNNKIKQATINSGYSYIFTGDECLNQLPREDSAILGRLSIHQSGLSYDDGSLRPERLANHLFRREAKQLKLL